jgi:hypothetical protein
MRTKGSRGAKSAAKEFDMQQGAAVAGNRALHDRIKQRGSEEGTCQGSTRRPQGRGIGAEWHIDGPAARGGGGP